MRKLEMYFTKYPSIANGSKKPTDAEPNFRLYTFDHMLKAYLPNCMLICRTVQEIRCQIM